MIINEGIGDIPTHVYKSLINVKFLFSIICCLIIIIIILTYENNIYSGISMLSEYNDEHYKTGFKWILSTLVIFSFFLFVDLGIQITGTTYNFYKLNAINISLKIFEVFLLALFFLDSWHYLTLLYILIIQLVCSGFEIYAIFFNFFSNFKKYNKIRNFEVKSKY